MSDLSSPPAPRLCHLTKWDSFEGYGFNLHAEKNKPGQFIGKIDPGSPAEAAGLLTGDKIVEVNNVNVGQENHKQVVQRIKTYPRHTSMLVVDKECEQYHQEAGIIVKGNLSYVVTSSSEGDSGELEEDDEEFIDTRLQEVKFEEPLEDTEESEEEESTVRRIIMECEEKDRITADEENICNRSSISSNKSESSGVSSLDSGRDEVQSVDDVRDIQGERDGMRNIQGGRNLKNDIQGQRDTIEDVKGDRGKKEEGSSLNLNMSAKQMRELVGQRKKRDPRTEQKMDWWKKHQIIQTL